MSAEWYWLDDTESIRWEGRPRLSAAAGSAVSGVFVVVTAGWLAATVGPLFAIGGLLGVATVLWGYLRITNTAYLVTTRAIWIKTGVIGCTVRRLSLSKVQNTAYEQSISGSVFGYGTVTIEVAGGRDIEFRRVDDPRGVQERIDDQIGETTSSVPGSLEQWQAVLSTVSEIRERLETQST